MSTKFWYLSGSGRIQILMSMEQAQSGSHQGQCDADVLALSQQADIHAQLEKIDPEDLRNELKEYGAWSAEELADHAQNLQRILWLACGDIVEGQGTPESEVDSQGG
jgi:hypothetical protein